MANIVPVIAGTVNRKPVSVYDKESVMQLTMNLQLADNLQTETETDSMLIGNDPYLDIVQGHKIEVRKGLYQLSSKLGWILTGRMCEEDNDLNAITLLVMIHGTNITKTEVLTNVDECMP